MIIICEKCGSEYEVGEIEEGKVLRCTKCGETWKHLLNANPGVIQERKVMEDFCDVIEEADDDEPLVLSEDKTDRLLLPILLILAACVLGYVFHEDITKFVQEYVLVHR